jgi:hypothetical protein
MPVSVTPLFLIQESFMSSKTAFLSRRGLFAGAATAGAVVAATAVLPGVLKQSAPVAAALPKPTRGGGYILSDHVRQYYKTTLV